MNYLFYDQRKARPSHANRHQAQTQQLFSRAIRQAASGSSPTDAFALEVRSDMATYIVGLLILNSLN